ncbi:MAG: diguanylate cyclase [Desulfopila sp.]|jgi:diguanylate cyclase (GGDEF)-like protein|nr:diguanylate cyclase [Desulfopila sp.]
MTPKKPISAPRMQSRHSDTAGKSAKGYIARLAFLLTSLLIVLASLSLVFTGRIASREADRQASANQLLLLDLALENQFSLLARDQLSLARWDVSVMKISRTLDRNFIANEFMDSLWYDFGIDQNLLIGPDNTVIAEAYREDVKFTSQQIATTEPLYRLAEQARKDFSRRKEALSAGHRQKDFASFSPPAAATHGFIVLDGQVALASAMAIVPDDGNAALPPGDPVILVSAIHLNHKLLAGLNDQLSFTDLRFHLHSSAASNQLLHRIVSVDGAALGHFSWTAAMPGQQIWYTIIPVIGLLGAFLALVAFAISWKIGKLTTSLATSERRNLFLAMHDPLSGLANRLQFNRVLDVSLENLPDHPFTLVHCDLDRFKAVNDTLGHAAGDVVIQAVAKRLSDAVPSSALVGRIGGDEFVILLQDCADSPEIENLALKIIADIHRPIDASNGKLAHIGISLGIAGAPECGTTAETIMAAADAALYQAKEMGRNRAVFAEKNNHSTTEQRI